MWFAGSQLHLVAGKRTPLPDLPTATPRTAALVESANSHMDAALDAVSRLRAEGPSVMALADRPAIESATDLDPAWSALERTDFSFGWWVSMLSPNMDSKALFRHKQLNPADSHIPAEFRESLSRFLRSLAPDLAALDNVTGQIGASEANEHFESLPYKELVPTRRTWIDANGNEHELDSIPSNPDEPSVVLKKNDRMYAIPVRSLPGLRAVSERRAFLTLEIGYAIAAWFRSLGLLSESQLNSLMDDVSKWSEKHRALSQPR